MPLVPRPTVCEHCKRFRVVVEAELTCEACGYSRNIKVSDLDKLPTRWPYHHDEFMSLRCRERCENCGHEVEEYFPHGRVPLDSLPGTYNSRVFIGGNYDLIGNLRDIKAAVHALGPDFVPILPYDDFQIPQGRVYEWDLRLLHSCKYAIFEVTLPAGELFEIARCAEYGVITLLAYQARGATTAPPRARTMLLESGTHEHRSYRDTNHLRDIVDEFLRQKMPTQWKRAIELMGYHFEEYYVRHKLYFNGEAEHTYSYRGLKVDIPDSRKTEQTHDFTITSGNIVEGSLKLDGPDYASWHRDNAKSGKRAEVGLVQFDPPLDHQSSPTDYTLSLKTKHAYMLTQRELSQIPPEEADDLFLAAGLEFASRVIPFPVETFRLCVEFPAGYQVNPKPATYFGTERRSDGLKIPPDSFSFENNIAMLEVRKPRIYYKYAITWQLPERLPEA